MVATYNFGSVYVQELPLIYVCNLDCSGNVCKKNNPMYETNRLSF